MLVGVFLLSVAAILWVREALYAPARLDARTDHVVHDLWLPSSQRATMNEEAKKEKTSSSTHHYTSSEAAATVPPPSVTPHLSKPSSWMRGWWMATTVIFGVFVIIGIIHRVVFDDLYKSLSYHITSYGIDVDPFDLWWFSVAMIGLQIRWWAQRTLGRLFTYQIGIRKDHHLISDGPYGKLRIRHPSYLGALLAILGTVMLALPSTHVVWWLVRLAAMAMFVLPLVLLRVPAEEAMLKQQFTHEWSQYTRTCPWKIVPFIY